MKLDEVPFFEIIVPPRMEPPPICLVDDPEYKKGNKNTAYFKNGSLYKVKPHNRKLTLDEDRGKAYQPRFIISDGKKYDLENPDSIRSIKIPKFTSSFLTRDMGYILRMCAGNELRPELTVPMVYKAINLMLVSPIAFGLSDYYRLIVHLFTIGEIKYGYYLLDEFYKVYFKLMEDSPYTEKNKYPPPEHYINQYYAKLEYSQILKLLPNKAPKSFSGYMRMRNGNTDNFLKLVEAGKTLNIKFYI